MKWMRGYGTRLVWNSVISTFNAPSNRRDAVRLEMIWAISRFRFVYVGRSISRFLRSARARYGSLPTLLHGLNALHDQPTITKQSCLTDKDPAANVVQRLVVIHDRHIRVLKE